MSRDVIRILCAMDAGNVEFQLALQCAPLITGLKISNLLLLQKKQVYNLWKILVQDPYSHQGFPHELGNLLGIPLEDVEGFIQNEGKNCLYSGYWKVYRDVTAKKNLFRMYELARELMIELVCNGVGMEEIIDTYRLNRSISGPGIAW